MPVENAVHAILERIDERLTALGMSDRQASLEATGVATAIRNIRRGSEPAPTVLAKLAPVLQTTPGFLAFGEALAGTSMATPVVAGKLAALAATVAKAAKAEATIPIIGQVAAGMFLAVDTEIDVPLYEERPIPADPDYPADWQFACEVVGTSVNNVAPDGAILGCVDINRARIHPRDGDLVVVERREAGGHKIERTAKRYFEFDDRFELRPDSSDPRWQTPIVVPREDNDDGESVQVLGLVTWLHTPVKRGGRIRRG